jgi:hypothetical protein
MDKLYQDLFIARKPAPQKFVFFTKDYITPEEYRELTRKAYPDKQYVYVLDNDDQGHGFWVREKYGKAKTLSLPKVCALKKKKPPVNWRSKNTH